MMLRIVTPCFPDRFIRNIFIITIVNPNANSVIDGDIPLFIARFNALKLNAFIKYKSPFLHIKCHKMISSPKKCPSMVENAVPNIPH